jgi:hypothetical protein
LAIDIVEYLESTGADLKYSGENVGPNDVAMPCPWCDDPSYHLTIHRTKGWLNCWRCSFDEYKIQHPKGWAPGLKALIKEIENCSWGKAKEIWEDIGGESGEDESWRVDGGEAPKVCELPDGCYPFSSPGPFTGARDQAFSYLLRRGFTKYHIEKYKLHFTATGWYQHRIIVPVYNNGVLVNWLGRRFSPSANGGRYMNCRLNGSIIRFAETLYGAETWSGEVLRIVEGAFDKMRIGDTSLSLNRSQFSRKQRNIITSLAKRSTPVHIILDPEAEHRAISIGEELSPFTPRIKIVRLPDESDPASLSFEEIQEAETASPYVDF